MCSLEIFLHVGTAAIDSLVVVIASDGKELKREEVFGSGKRHALGNYPAINLTVPDARPDLYLGVQSGKPVTLPVRVRTAQGILKETAARDLFFTFYLGVMAVMLLYNGFLFFAVEDKSYLYYVLFLVGVAGSQFMLEGYSWVLGLDSTSWLGARVVHAIGAISGIATILFFSSNASVRSDTRNSSCWFCSTTICSLILLIRSFSSLALAISRLNWLMRSPKAMDNNTTISMLPTGMAYVVPVL